MWWGRNVRTAGFITNINLISIVSGDVGGPGWHNIPAIFFQCTMKPVISFPPLLQTQLDLFLAADGTILQRQLALLLYRWPPLSFWAATLLEIIPNQFLNIYRFNYQLNRSVPGCFRWHNSNVESLDAEQFSAIDQSLSASPVRWRNLFCDVISVITFCVAAANGKLLSFCVVFSIIQTG